MTLEALAAGYVPTDDFFGPPYVDVDEQRASPTPHRYVHGGFTGTATRFSFYFLPPENYSGRLLQTLEGGAGGSELTNAGPMATFYGALGHAVDCGAYLVESNQGHAGGDLCPKAGEDATVYSYRASAEAARFSRHVATLVYGEPPHHAYLFGGSGGGCRTLWCMENVDDVWDGAVPFKVGNRYTFALLSALTNARRLLGPDLTALINATAPGGSADPFDGLGTDAREQLALLYRLGFPRGAEASIRDENYGIALWALEGSLAVEADPQYFARFWTEPGYAGRDRVQDLEPFVVNAKTTVRRVVSAGELAAGEGDAIARLAAGWVDPATPLAIEVDEPVRADAAGATLSLVSGAAVGRRQTCIATVGDALMVSPRASLDGTAVGFDSVETGDEITVDNRDFLAFCYYHRHHTPPTSPPDALVVDGTPIYAQHPGRQFPVLFGGPDRVALADYTGRFTGKIALLQHLHDSTTWPAAAIEYEQSVRKAIGDGAQDRFRLWWIDHAEHSDVSLLLPGDPPRATTRLIDFQGCIAQALHDVIAWVEEGRPPAPSTTFSVTADFGLVLPEDAHARRGIQPTAHLTANGSIAAAVAATEPVTLRVEAAVPPDSGAIIDIQWDPEGSGHWIPGRLDCPQPYIDATLEHVYADEGVYFPAVKVMSHRDGDPNATTRLVPNLGRARVTVA